VRLGVAKIQSVNDHPDVSRVLTGLPYVGNFDQLERRLMHRGFETLITVPVGISLLDHDVAFQQQPFQNQLHVERFIAEITHAERDVLKVTEDRYVLWGVIVTHTAGSKIVVGERC